MCQNFTLLAKTNNHRFINCCKHRTVHIVWNNITISLLPTDFTRLVRLLEKVGTEVSPIKISENGCTLIQQEDGYIQVWLAGTGLIFSLVDFLILVNMARAAVRQLERTPTKTTKSTRQPRKPHIKPIRDISETSFFLN